MYTYEPKHKLTHVHYIIIPCLLHIHDLRLRHIPDVSKWRAPDVSAEWIDADSTDYMAGEGYRVMI